MVSLPRITTQLVGSDGRHFIFTVTTTVTHFALQNVFCALRFRTHRSLNVRRGFAAKRAYARSRLTLLPLFCVRRARAVVVATR